MAAKKKKTIVNKITELSAHWAFLIGVLLSVFLGIFLPGRQWIAGILAVLGLMVGIINITEKEHTKFLVAALALIVASQAMKFIPLIGKVLENIMTYLVIFTAVATVAVSLIVIWKLAKNR